MSSTSAHAGFSLIETTIATALLATAVVGLAELFAVATRSNLSARTTTYATVLAAQKLEQLRAAGGVRGGGRLDTDVAGWVDYLDHNAMVVGGGGAPPPNTVYTRRWSSRVLPGSAAASGRRAIVQVVVTRRQSGVSPLAGRLPDQARLTTVMGALP
jgi:hypothetical protein